jgi:hypothetical protein
LNTALAACGYNAFTVLGENGSVGLLLFLSTNALSPCVANACVTFWQGDCQARVGSEGAKQRGLKKHKGAPSTLLFAFQIPPKLNILSFDYLALTLITTLSSLLISSLISLSLQFFPFPPLIDFSRWLSLEAAIKVAMLRLDQG